MFVASWCCTRFCVVLCVSFSTGHFVMVPLNLTYLHCLQHSFFDHLFNLYCSCNLMFRDKNRYIKSMTKLFLFQQIMYFENVTRCMLLSRVASHLAVALRSCQRNRCHQAVIIQGQVWLLSPLKSRSTRLHSLKTDEFYLNVLHEKIIARFCKQCVHFIILWYGGSNLNTVPPLMVPSVYHLSGTLIKNLVSNTI